MKKFLYTLPLLIMSIFTFAADDVTFQASAPAQVIMGRPFRITYSVNQHAKDLRVPEIADFDIIAGPFSSQSSSTQFVNGKMSSSFSLTYTYTLLPKKEGTFSIQPASIVVGGTQYRSNGLKIKVLPEDEEPQQASSSAAAQGNSNRGSNSEQSSNSGDIFIKTIVSKTHVHEQECILVSYKLYFTGVEVAQFTNNTKFPDYKGFLKQELDMGEVQTNLEHYNGRNYQTAVLSQTLLYPQKAGDIQIEPASLEAVLRVPNRSQVRSIFGDFFNSYSTITKMLVAPGVTIHVDALPTGKPTGFSGGVGHFNISSTITGEEITTNEPVTITLDISGTGNMKLLKTPAVDWPEGFEVYDPKITNNFRNTTNGVTGNKSIEYLAIARAAGNYTIPAIEFSYFDTEEGVYKTLKTEEYTIHVARGANDTEATVVNNFTNKEDIKQLGSDIRYIYTGELPQAAEKNHLLTGLWWLFYLVPSLLASLLFFIFRKRIQENADITRVKYKKANKVAQKRLKTAKKLMQANDNAFYEEIERAAWTYLSDRLSIPTANLNKENIADILRQKGTEETLINEVHQVLSDAEFARYAPSAASSKQALYTATTQLIDHLENIKL